MKFTKLSLIAAIAASSAIAGGDIAPVEPAPVVEATSPWTFDGDAKLYYKTNSSTPGASIFDQPAAQGQAAVSADIGYAINNNWKINAGVTGLMTLGLDDSVVGGVWLYAGANADNLGLPVTSVGDALWIDTLNITGTMFDGKLTTVLGRQMLDTPLAFSETWSIAPNTFDAAVALANPIDNLTLVAAYIYDGNGNGPRLTTFDGVTNAGGLYTGEASAGGFTGSSGYFPVLGIDKGAWAVAAIYNFTENITGQAWYYDVMDVAQAVWVQADAKVSGFTLGAQYAWIGADDTLNNLAGNTIDDASAYALKVGYGMDAYNVWAAYSDVDDVANGRDAISISNTATMLSGAGWGGQGVSGQSKLYTEAWWNYGYVGQAGATTYALGADYTLGTVSIFDNTKLSAQYTSVSDAKMFLGGDTRYDMDEIALIAGTEVAGLNVQVAYLNYQTTTKPVGAASSDDITDEVQLYLTYKF